MTDAQWNDAQWNDAQWNAEVQWGALRPILQDLTDRLAHIEQFLAASGLQVPSQPSVAYGSSPGQAAAAAQGISPGGDPSPFSQVPDHIAALARSGKTIEAIKEYRSATGVSLKEAKAIVEQIAQGY
jgi:ribosomal protein L7/L12